MPAVSAEFSHAHANVAASDQDGSDRAAPSDPPRSARAPLTQGADFGPNEWLVDELYQRYQADPSSVDRAWWNFFADYRPEPTDGRSRAAAPPPAPTQTGRPAPGTQVAGRPAQAPPAPQPGQQPAAPGQQPATPGQQPAPGQQTPPASQQAPSQPGPGARPQAAQPQAAQPQ